jgi:hypothetical protein
MLSLVRVDTAGVPSRTRDRNLTGLRVVVVAVATAALLWPIFRLTGSGDYQVYTPVQGDNAGPGLNALLHGHIAGMVSLQPLMGLTSVLWRLPFLAVAVRANAGLQTSYDVGAAACLIIASGLVAWLVARARSLPQLAYAAVGAAAIAVGPATLQAPGVGHPEEVLASVLAVGAVLCAYDDRRGAAAVLLGLAIGTKQWALLAAPCVLLSLPGARAAVATKALLVAAPLTALLPLASPTAFAQADAGVGNLRYANVFSLWWPIGPTYPDSGHVIAHLLPLGLTRSEAAAFALIVAVAAIWLYARRAGAGRLPRVDGLALLCALGLLRCITDPDPLAYNFVAVVIPLAAWEAGRLRRPPVLTVVVCVALALLKTGPNAFVAGRHAGLGEPLLTIVWLAGAVLLACYLVHCAFRPATARTRRAVTTRGVLAAVGEQA